MHTLKGTSGDKFEFKAPRSGMYKFCFNNPYSTPETVSFYIHVGHIPNEHDLAKDGKCDLFYTSYFIMWIGLLTVMWSFFPLFHILPLYIYTIQNIWTPSMSKSLNWGRHWNLLQQSRSTWKHVMLVIVIVWSFFFFYFFP